MVKKILLIMLIVFSVTGTAFAADKPFGGEGEIGMMITSGNSDTESANGKIGALSMKLSYTIDRQSKVPVDSEKTNTETALTLVYGF